MELSVLAKKLYEKYISSIKETNQFIEEFNIKQKKTIKIFWRN